MASAKKFHLKKVLIIIFSCIVAFSLLSMVITKIVYDSIFDRYDEPIEVPAQLSTMVQQRQVCRFPSGDNTLTGYYYSAPNPEQAHGLIVLTPGFNAGGDNYLWQISELRNYGWAVFTFDTTGTQQSQGDGQVGFSQSVPDLAAALKYVEKCNRFGYNELILMGHSRGAYAACCILAQQEDVAAVVAVSGVNSAMEGVMHMSTQAIGYISYGNYGFLWLYQAILFGSDTLQLDAAQIISEEDVPVLVVQGTQDDQAPTDSCSIYSHKEEIKSSQVEYLLCEAGHTDVLYDEDGTANDALMEEIHNFLIRSIKK